MKILFITDLYPIQSGETTTPRTLHNFVLEWIKQNHDVDVIRPNFVFNSALRGKKFHKTGFYEFEGVKIYNVNYFSPFLFDIEHKLTRHCETNIFGFNKSNHRSSLPQDAEEIASVDNSREKPNLKPRNDGKYDLIIAHMPSGIIFANKLVEKYKHIVELPLVCGVHCSDIEVLTKPIYKYYFNC